MIASGMVLQQSTNVNIWGWSSPGENISVQGTWSKEKSTTISDEKGRWLVKLSTGMAGGPYKLIIEGKERIELNDVLLGEVWFCSGQSNMEFSIKMLGGWKYYPRNKKEIKEKQYQQIRLCNISRKTSAVPLETCEAKWMNVTVKNVENFSAVAWFYANALSKQLQVPVGVICSAWGGTPAEAWMEKKYIENEPELRFYLNDPFKRNWDAGRCSYLYNAMIHPLVNYTIKGVIWYQGESNIKDADRYRNLFSILIGSWRDAWRQGDFPFYYVQIAPFDYGEKFPYAAYLREAQLQSLSVSNTGMVVTLDIGNVTDIHPKNKREVGRRLALWALAKTYHRDSTGFSGPLYKSYRVDDDCIRIFFDHVDGELVAKSCSLNGFEAAGDDGTFHPAAAIIDKGTVVVAADNMEFPKWIRYAFSNTDSATLFNKTGLPASPFRTDTSKLFCLPVYVTIKKDTINKQLLIVIDCVDSTCMIRYTPDGKEPDNSSLLYTSPIPVDGSCTVLARAFRNGIPSTEINQARFDENSASGKSVQIKYPCSSRYTGGADCLTDGIRGTKDFRDGHWQGYEGADFEALIDMGGKIPVRRISTSFLQNSDSWIFLPVEVTFSSSEDGKIYHDISFIRTEESPKLKTTLVKEYSWPQYGNPSGSQPFFARYIKVSAKNMGKCPSWHPGHGKKAWIFVDEVLIETAR